MHGVADAASRPVALPQPRHHRRCCRTAAPWSQLPQLRRIRGYGIAAGCGGSMGLGAFAAAGYRGASRGGTGDGTVVAASSAMADALR